MPISPHSDDDLEFEKITMTVRSLTCSIVTCKRASRIKKKREFLIVQQLLQSRIIPLSQLGLFMPIVNIYDSEMISNLFFCVAVHQVLAHFLGQKILIADVAERIIRIIVRIGMLFYRLVDPCSNNVCAIPQHFS